MTISRPAPRRWPVVAAAAAAGAVVGLLAGLALAGGDDGTSAEQALRDTQAQLRQAAGLLEIVPVEYGEAVRGGEVVRAPEYRGARDAVERSRDIYSEARPAVALFDAARTRAVDERYARLERLLAARAAAARVEREARELRALLVPPNAR